MCNKFALLSRILTFVLKVSFGQTLVWSFFWTFLLFPFYGHYTNKHTNCFVMAQFSNKCKSIEMQFDQLVATWQVNTKYLIPAISKNAFLGDSFHALHRVYWLRKLDWGNKARCNWNWEITNAYSLFGRRHGDYSEISHSSNALPSVLTLTTAITRLLVRRCSATSSVS